MVVRDRSFPNGSPVCDYWLSRCEGFTVRAGSRNLGVVERLAFATGGRVHTLVLQRRHRRSHPLEAGQVLAVVPARQLLLARRAHHELPNVRPVAHAMRRAAVLVWRLVRRMTTAVVVVALRWAARVTLRLVRAAGDEIRNRKRERDLHRDQHRKPRDEKRDRLPERPLDRVAGLARYARRLQHLARRLPRRGEELAAWAAASRAHQVRSAKLEHAHTVANEYVFALGHDRLDVGGEEQPSAPVHKA
ncbi:MAG: hypothetical protein ACRDL2_03395 [Gaiellaceae bacterium]